MTAEYDPAVRLETLAVACNVALNTLRLARVAGKIPPPDAVVCRARVWKLSTIRSWSPRVADRCAAILAALDSIPLKAA